MKLTFTCKLSIDSVYHNVLDEIALHASKFYNMTLYEQLQKNYLTQTEYYHLFENHFRFGYLQAHTYCQAIKQAMKDMKSFLALVKKYKNDPKHNQKPSVPRFKHEKRLLAATFLKTAIRIKDDHLLLSIGKKMKSDKQIKVISVVLPEEVCGLLSDKNIKMITVEQCDDLKHQLRIVYELDEPCYKESGDIMSIDLGVSNLAAITFMDQTNQYLIDGQVIKCRLAGYNNKLASAYSHEMMITGNQRFKLTNKMKRILKTRYNFTSAYIHTASRMIVNLAITHGVNRIVIGDFKTIKVKNRIKYFVQIPHAKLIEQIKYKAKLVGIKVIMQNESYTSSVSSLDLEIVDQQHSDKSRRFKRGLFKTTFGVINSDINGSLNIMRKYVKDKNIPRLIIEARDKGLRENPVRILVI